MAVEIYREPELESMIDNMEHVEEWMKQVQELDLKGQAQLISKDVDDKPSIYINMNASLCHVFKVLCPRKVDYKEYDKSTIPLEVLKEIALCVHEKYFHKISIWYDDREPDPIVVGHISGSSSSPLHLIARWGDEILPFEELRIKAKNRLTSSVKRQYELMGTELERTIDKYMNGDWAHLSIDFSNVDVSEIAPGGDLPF